MDLTMVTGAVLYGASVDSSGAISSGASLASTADLTEFPSEAPSNKEVDDWLEANKSFLSSNGYDVLLRGETPADLIGLRELSVAASIPALSGAEVTAAGPVAAARHNEMVTRAARDKRVAMERLQSELRSRRNKLAGQIQRAMHRTAPVRLKRLQVAHAVSGHDDCYNGIAMYKEVQALQNAIALSDDMLDHDREYEKMRDSVIPDNCT